MDNVHERSIQSNHGKQKHHWVCMMMNESFQSTSGKCCFRLNPPKPKSIWPISPWDSSQLCVPHAPLEEEKQQGIVCLQQSVERFGFLGILHFVARLIHVHFHGGGSLFLGSLNLTECRTIRRTRREREWGH